MNKRLLFEILSALVQEWGKPDVEQALRQVTAEPAIGRRRISNVGRLNLGEQQIKTPASDQAVKLSESTENKDLIVQLAKQFDNKDFLPTLRDVYLFLSKRGVEGVHVKNRSESFRKILDVLISSPREGLEKMLREGVYLGPSRLGPLSDAIRATGESMRASDFKPTEPNKSKD